jgi:hypothetical protein
MILAISANTLVAQNYWFGSYLEVSDSITQKTYRIKKDKYIEVKLKSRADWVATSIHRFVSDSVITFDKLGKLSVNDIKKIRFRSETTSRTVRQLFYPSMLLIVSAYYLAQASTTPRNITYIPLASLAIEGVALLAYTNETKKVGYPRKNDGTK